MKVPKGNAIGLFTCLLITASCLIPIPNSALAQQSARACGTVLHRQRKSIEDHIHGFVERNGFYSRTGPNGEFYSERDHIAFDGCTATVHALIVSAGAPFYKKTSMELDVLFNLVDLDPKVSAVPKDLNGNSLPNNREWVLLRTADGYRSIAIRRGNSIVSPISVFALQASADVAENRKLADDISSLVARCKRDHNPPASSSPVPGAKQL